MKKNVISPVVIAFILPFFYWIYLLCSSNMVMVFDAATFEDLGLMIYKKGWVEFFKTGPHNEPIYPFLISTAMKVGDAFHLPYPKIQTAIQMAILLLSQVLTYQLLKKLNIQRNLAAGIILYMGISPAIVNSVFSLWSEIAAFPFVLGIVFAAVNSWKSILSKRYGHIICSGAVLAVVFICATSVKAIFEYVFFLFMIPFILLSIQLLLRKEKNLFINSLVHVCVAVVIFNVYLISYKTINQKYNGHYMLTDRGPYILYGNAAKRMQPLTFKRLLTCIAFVPGDGFCNKIFGKEECDFWALNTVEIYGLPMLAKVNRTLPPEKVDLTLINLAKSEIKKNPFQYALLFVIDGFKMFFWESTKIGFVSYPPWLTALFDFTPLKNLLRASVFLITFLAFCFTFRYVFRNRSRLLDLNQEDSGDVQIFFLMLTLLLAFIGMYSFSYIHTRYALPITPLFLSCIAFLFDKIMLKKM